MFDLAGFNLVKHLFHSRFRAFDQLGVAFFANTVTGNFLGLVFIGNDNKIIAGGRRTLQAENLYRRRRTGLIHFFAHFVKHGADTPPLLAGNNDVPDVQRALLNQNRCNGTAAFFHLGFNNRTLGFTIRIGFQIQNFGLQQNCLN